MADKTKIEWSDATVNAINGCTLVSAGCKNCYAARLAATRMKNVPSRAGLARFNAAGVAAFTGEVRLNEAALMQPLKWKRPRRIFWNAHGDTFHLSIPDEWIDRMFAVMAMTPQHTHQILTKRPERMRDYLQALTDEGPADRLASVAGEHFGDDADVFVANYINGWSRPKCAPDDNPADGSVRRWPLPNVWAGASVEDQPTADERIPHLRATPAAVHFISLEPMLGPVDLEYPVSLWPDGPARCCSGHECGCMGMPTDPPLIWGIDQVIVGGESGPNARPMHPDWARDIRDQCAAAGVPFLFKQWGEWFPYGEIDASGQENSVTRGERSGLWHEWPDADGGFSVKLGKKAAGRLLDGVEHNGFPEVRA
jgi:protein gp37